MNSTEPMIHIYIYWCHNILIPQNFEPGWVKKKIMQYIYILNPAWGSIFRYKILNDNANKLGFDILPQCLSDHD